MTVTPQVKARAELRAFNRNPSTGNYTPDGDAGTTITSMVLGRRIQNITHDQQCDLRDEPDAGPCGNVTTARLFTKRQRR
jgi:hypothetical protein